MHRYFQLGRSQDSFRLTHATSRIMSSGFFARARRRALWIERYRSDRRSVACPAGPARSMALNSLMAFSLERPLLQRVSLRWSEVADAALAVHEVVPAHEVASPAAGLLKGGEVTHRKLGAVPGRF